ncbi:MAG: DUF3486 family protein [Labilithrix sp.]|nr:DUF3486 family protein [Labilithrix sp.]MCW5814215.1 DUF3486 family protein [Labilithrix sp.]
MSESAVYRYSLNFQSLARELRFVREMAQAAGRELDAIPDGADPGRLLVESLQALMFRARAQLAQSETVDEKTLESLTVSARNLAQAMKTNVDTEARIIDRAAKRAARVAAEVAREQGISETTIEMIKAQILGLTPATLRAP